jgi:hypothetical protein
MPILHVLQGDKDERVSRIINLDSVREVMTEYKKQQDFSSHSDEEKPKAEMIISYKKMDTDAVKIEVDEDTPTLFVVMDNLGEELERTSNVVDAEKAIMLMLAVGEFSPEEEEEVSTEKDAGEGKESSKEETAPEKNVPEPA